MENETFKLAVNLMRYLSNCAAETNAYRSWNSEFCRKEIDQSFETIKTLENPPCNSEQFWKDVFNLPEEQKGLLGFTKFDAHDTKMCIPLWIWQCLPDDMIFDGKPKKELDNDIRFGCVFWRA